MCGQARPPAQSACPASSASAMLPSPTPHSFRNQRRASSVGGSSWLWSAVTCHRFWTFGFSLIVSCGRSPDRANSWPTAGLHMRISMTFTFHSDSALQLQQPDNSESGDESPHSERIANAPAHSLVIVSSRFRITRASAVQAATSAALHVVRRAAGRLLQSTPTMCGSSSPDENRFL